MIKIKLLNKNKLREVNMKRLINKFLSLILCVSIITICSASVVFAGIATSERTIVEDGVTYKAYANVEHRYDKIEADTTLTRQSGNSGAGCLGVQAKLFNEADQLIQSTDWKYNNISISSESIQTAGTSVKGNYYSYGNVKIYNGNGYSTYSLYKSPFLELKSNVSYAINKNGQTYGSGVYDSDLGSGPDLIESIGMKGTCGYVLSSDLNGKDHTTPEEAIAQKNNNSRTIPLYDKEGKTVIDEFKIENVEAK
ncbi:MAG: hypothetical protein ACJAX4_003792 [Clostridium sp.]